MSRTIAITFTNRTSFSQESWDESNKIMKSQKISWPWGLGPGNYIWATWAQKTYPAICPEHWLQFSQTRSHFLKNHEMNPIKSWNLKKLLDLGVWDLETTLGHLGPEDVSNHMSRTFAAIFTNRPSFSQESWDKSNKIMKSQKISWAWSLGPRNYIWATCAQKTYQAICPEP